MFKKLENISYSTQALVNLRGQIAHVKSRRSSFFEQPSTQVVDKKLWLTRTGNIFLSSIFKQLDLCYPPYITHLTFNGMSSQNVYTGSAERDEGDLMGTDDEDTFKILIATDNHIGFMEDDAIRGQDSFRTFEEILYIAKVEQVDFVLLGGDLFHQNSPSRACLYQTLKMLRRHCYGDRPSSIWIASDQSVNFPEEFCTANYLDENINISLPVFSIHGNHDDPSGTGNLCALHLLSVTGMVNYFGASPKVDNVVVHPILMQKGRSKLALYGLGNIRDERLHRHWRQGRVKFMRPEDEDWLGDNCFNMFVLHQNRAAHGRKSYIPTEFIDGFLDLIVWGHEHDCKIAPELMERFAISQPGSSIATSLAKGEALAKHIGLLRVKGTSFSLEKIRLKTVRPFICTDLQLKANNKNLSVKDVKGIQNYLAEKVEELIIQARSEWEEQQRSSPYKLPFWEYDDEDNTSEQPNMPLPLIRIRVDYSGGYETFNPSQFGQRFINRVANAREILRFHRSSRNSNDEMEETARESLRAQTEMLTDLTMAIPDRLDTVKVESLVEELLSRDLFILPETRLENALLDIVTKDDKTAIKSFFNKSIKQATQNVQFVPDMDLTLDYVKRKTTVLKESINQRLDNERAAAAGGGHSDRTSTTPTLSREIAFGTQPGTSDASRTIFNSDEGDNANDTIQRETQRRQLRTSLLSDDDTELQPLALSSSNRIDENATGTAIKGSGGKKGTGRGSKTRSTRGKTGTSTSRKRRLISDDDDADDDDHEEEDPIEDFTDDENEPISVTPTTSRSITNRRRVTQTSSYNISSDDDEGADATNSKSIQEEISSSTTRGNRGNKAKGKTGVRTKRAAPSSSPVPAASSSQTFTTNTQDTQSSQKKRRVLPGVSRTKK
ncbi:Metallo-dependent phosphatase-like protein [Mycotypha africana]|uniref:Metallo-dependent phosphatase-like protein n=1 Tax=Mycotypha africana TaxID=64632 RepID=UPI0023012556|nr:Metallo-dependent phosphatase-like protein [Mycotypha africana]KAI8984006.1 Metallo-dependent phosphatase-like protein [Mycotypha africana]